jgi:Fe-S-cluster containining protein
MSGIPRAAEPLCARCDAVCCRLTVVVQPEDRTPQHLTEQTKAGLTVMARDTEGWCVAIDAARMCCSIYEARPDVCRRFVMAGPYCRDVREDYMDRTARGIPLSLF